MVHIRFVGIDLSTKTGFCIHNAEGQLTQALEIPTKKLDDPQRMIQVASEIKQYLNPLTDKVIIEGFAYGAKGQGVSFQYGIGWIVREMLVLNNIPYVDVPPSMLKKFACNRGNAKKEDLVLPIYKKWGFESISDNIRDAFVLSKIGYSMYNHENLLEYEKEVLRKIKKI